MCSWVGGGWAGAYRGGKGGGTPGHIDHPHIQACPPVPTLPHPPSSRPPQAGQPLGRVVMGLYGDVTPKTARDVDAPGHWPPPT